MLAYEVVPDKGDGSCLLAYLTPTAFPQMTPVRSSTKMTLLLSYLRVVFEDLFDNFVTVCDIDSLC
jgi:hypothetical protein